MDIASVFPLVDYGYSENFFYNSPLAYGESPDLEKLRRVDPKDEVVFPAHFLMSPKKDFISAELAAMPFKKRLLIGLGAEELENAPEVRRLLNSGWSLDLILDRPLDWDLERRLALYRDLDVRLVVLANRRFSLLQTLLSIPSEWRVKSRITFLKPGERTDIFFSADEVLVFQDDLQKDRPELELPLVVYKPLISTVSWHPSAEFFAQPNVENYGPHFFKLPGWSRLRRWMILGFGEKRRDYRILVEAIFAPITPLQSLLWPFKKLFWFLEFQWEKRALPKIQQLR